MYDLSTGRCFVAACLDLSLAAQADTPHEAKEKLEYQIKDYIEEALSDKQYAVSLLNDRKAPFSMWLKYYSFKLIAKFSRRKSRSAELFKESLPDYCAS